VAPSGKADAVMVVTSLGSVSVATTSNTNCANSHDDTISADLAKLKGIGYLRANEEVVRRRGSGYEIRRG